MISRRLIIRHLTTLALGSSFLNACTAKPVNSQTILSPESIARTVAAHYGETSAALISVQKTEADPPPHDPMYLIGLTGQFHKGSLMATSLSFSALADKMYVWYILAHDAQGEEVWMDRILPT